MRALWWVLLVGCSSPSASPLAPEPGSEPEPEPAGSGSAKRTYLSDCSLTHPVARDPCSGPAAPTRGLATCASRKVRRDQACTRGAPSCYVEVQCPDGRTVPKDYLVCAESPPGRCFTRSSRDYKRDIEYLTTAERDALARQLEALPLARFRYTDQEGGPTRLGFLTQDAAGAPFVAGDTVDLYALMASAIATLQVQDERIRQLEQRLEACEH